MKDKIVINNQLINYYKFNEEGTKTILFLHGWRSNGEIWSGIANKLKNNNFLMLAIDFPGFGESSFPKKDFTVQDYSEILMEFIKKLELNKVVLVGHSFGGRVAMKLAANNPELIEKLILVDSAGLVPKASNFKRIIAKVAKPFFKPKFMQKPREAIYRQIGAEDYIATPELKQTFLNVINEDLRPILLKIKSETLIIWGENDVETPIEMAEIIHQEIKNSQEIILSNAGHFSFLDQPDRFVQALIKFTGDKK